MPPDVDAEATLAAAADALGVDLPPAAAARLQAFGDLLQRWNRTYNLTAIRDARDVLTHHLSDCLAVIPPIMRGAVAAPSSRLRVLDVGSGGGLPGAVIAIVCPSVDVTCIDAVGKKVAFVRQVAAELQLSNLSAQHDRVEAAKGAYDLITSRAFATLGDFTGWTRHLLAPGGTWVAMKGKFPQDEIDSLPATVRVFHVEPIVVPGLQADRCLVWMQPEHAP